MKSDIEWAKRTLNLFALDYGGKDEAKALVIVLAHLDACERALRDGARGKSSPEEQAAIYADLERRAKGSNPYPLGD